MSTGNHSPITASDEGFLRWHCLFLLDVWLAYDRGQLPHNCVNLDAMKSNDAYRRHFRFVLALDLQGSVKRKLFGAVVRLISSEADKMRPWDGGVAMRAKWPLDRVGVIASLNPEDIRQWFLWVRQQSFAPMNASPSSPEMMDALVAWADDLFDRTFRHSIEVRYEQV